MPRPVDLPRIRRALANLDRIAAEQPDYCQGQGQWDETEVKKLMGTPAPVRMKAYRARLRAQGWKQVAMFLSPEAVSRLDELRRQFPEKPIGEIVSVALTDHAQVTRNDPELSDLSQPH